MFCYICFGKVCWVRLALYGIVCACSAGIHIKKFKLLMCSAAVLQQA